MLLKDNDTVIYSLNRVHLYISNMQISISRHRINHQIIP